MKNIRIHILLMLIIVGEYFEVVFSSSIDGENTILRRHKRKLPLIFHDFGVSQFVCGFGIPVDSDLESVTSGIVFKSQLPLPASPEELRNHTTHNVNGRLLNEEGYHTLNMQIRWNLYKALELWATNIGLNGRDCVLKTLCEANRIPFNSETGDLWHDIVHIIFSPFSSTDEICNHVNNEYLAAAKMGLSNGNNCDQVFKKCPKSLLNIFSEVF